MSESTSIELKKRTKDEQIEYLAIKNLELISALAQAKCSCASKVEETIKRIEKKIKHLLELYDENGTQTYINWVNALEYTLQIIKEQFPMSESCQHQQEERK